MSTRNSSSMASIQVYRILAQKLEGRNTLGEIIADLVLLKLLPTAKYHQ